MLKKAQKKTLTLRSESIGITLQNQFLGGGGLPSSPGLPGGPLRPLGGPCRRKASLMMEVSRSLWFSLHSLPTSLKKRNVSNSFAFSVSAIKVAIASTSEGATSSSDNISNKLSFNSRSSSSLGLISLRCAASKASNCCSWVASNSNCLAIKFDAPGRAGLFSSDVLKCLNKKKPFINTKKPNKRYKSMFFFIVSSSGIGMNR